MSLLWNEMASSKCGGYIYSRRLLEICEIGAMHFIVVTANSIIIEEN